MELGKFPNEIAEHMTIDDLMELNNYQGIINEEIEAEQKKEAKTKHKPRR